MTDDKTERDRLLYADAVIAELKQFTKLLESGCPIEELAHRMAKPKKDMEIVLKLFGMKK